HDSTLLASSHTVKSKIDIKSPTYYPCVGFNSLVHSIRALSALRRSGLRTASTAAKPCQGDSLEFYLITGNIKGIFQQKNSSLGDYKLQFSLILMYLPSRVNMAHAIMADGGVIPPVGLNMVALAAQRQVVPFVVLACIHK
nr:translation initiation factor eIF-2B subunit beta-like [Tanacetum cinerariifolium]